jgi:hypothetical protein
MIDSTTEQVFNLKTAAKTVDRLRLGQTLSEEIDRQARTNISTLYRWSTIGCRGVVLETIQIGATRCTSREALERFFAALSRGRSSRVPSGAGASSRSEKAAKALEMLGA